MLHVTDEQEYVSENTVLRNAPISPLCSPIPKVNYGTT